MDGPGLSHLGLCLEGFVVVNPQDVVLTVAQYAFSIGRPLGRGISQTGGSWGLPFERFKKGV